MKSLLLALALGAVAVPASAANLLVNGDFETPTPPAGGYLTFSGGDSFTGWNVVGPNAGVFLIDTDYAETGVTFPAQSGRASIDLTGYANQGPDAGISQTVSTIAGQLYTLSFWVGNADGSGNSNYLLPSTVRLSINGGALQDFTNSDTTPFTTNWKFFSTSFTATGGATSIAFFNGTDLADAETGLDNVVLDGPAGPVPEPAAWTLMIVGLAAAGARLRTRLSPLAARGERNAVRRPPYLPRPSRLCVGRQQTAGSERGPIGVDIWGEGRLAAAGADRRGGAAAEP